MLIDRNISGLLSGDIRRYDIARGNSEVIMASIGELLDDKSFFLYKKDARYDKSWSELDNNPTKYIESRLVRISQTSFEYGGLSFQDGKDILGPDREVIRLFYETSLDKASASVSIKEYDLLFPMMPQLLVAGDRGILLSQGTDKDSPYGKRHDLLFSFQQLDKYIMDYAFHFH